MRFVLKGVMQSLYNNIFADESMCIPGSIEKIRFLFSLTAFDSRSHAPRGNVFQDAPRPVFLRYSPWTRRGAAKIGCPRGAWEPGENFKFVKKILLLTNFAMFV